MERGAVTVNQWIKERARTGPKFRKRIIVQVGDQDRKRRLPGRWMTSMVRNGRRGLMGVGHRIVSRSSTLQFNSPEGGRISSAFSGEGFVGLQNPRAHELLEDLLGV